ncbi:MAG: hypothetical protein OXN17_18700 [Candidatus Poribacteria bacterium]|nr:hypothetical protein [Candidatus Poribacteria bacterium]MDE0504724.1 hypothetical protein [Candidatus Poribacteria bacterium]
MNSVSPILRRCLFLPILALMVASDSAAQELDLRIVFSSNRGGNWDIYSMDMHGNNLLQLSDDPVSDEYPACSPDGRRIAFNSNRGLTPELYVMNSNGKNAIRLTHDSFQKGRPSWSPDGKRIVFASFRLPAANWEIYAIGADGENEINLTQHKEPDLSPSWSPDGNEIAFVSMFDGGAFGSHHIFVMNANGKGRRNLTGDTGLVNSFDPTWSPDGRKIAFRSLFNLESYEIYVMNAEGKELERLTEESNSSMPAFSPDGSKIAFVSMREGGTDIYLMDANGMNAVNLTRSPPGTASTSPSWLPRALAVNPKGKLPISWGVLKRTGHP